MSILQCEIVSETEDKCVFTLSCLDSVYVRKLSVLKVVTAGLICRRDCKTLGCGQCFMLQIIVKFKPFPIKL